MSAGETGGTDKSSRAKVGVIKIIVAFLICWIVIPSPIQLSIGSQSASLTSSSNALLVVGTSTMQYTQINGGLQNPPTIPTSVALHLFYSYVQALQLKFDPSVTLQRSAIFEGQNISFVVKSPASNRIPQGSNFNVYVFLVSPDGVIEATYPSGATIYASTNQPTPYMPQGFGFVSLMDAYNQNGVAFTWNVPNDGSELGTWRLYSFVYGQSGSQAQQTSILVYGASVDEISVSAPPSFDLPLGLLFVGSFLAIYQVETYAVSNYQVHGGSIRRWLVKQSPLILGIILISAYFYLAYLRS